MYYNDFETNKQTNETKEWVSGTTTYAVPNQWPARFYLNK